MLRPQINSLHRTIALVNSLNKTIKKSQEIIFALDLIHDADRNRLAT